MSYEAGSLLPKQVRYQAALRSGNFRIVSLSVTILTENLALLRLYN